MARRLFNLRNVPEDEAEEIRRLLGDNGIEIHETSAGFLGLMTAAIWVTDESRYQDAVKLLEAYQHTRYQQARNNFLRKQADGSSSGFCDRFRQQPLSMLLRILAAVCLLALTTLPFWL